MFTASPGDVLSRGWIGKFDAVFALDFFFCVCAKAWEGGDFACGIDCRRLHRMPISRSIQRRAKKVQFSSTVCPLKRFSWQQLSSVWFRWVSSAPMDVVGFRMIDRFPDMWNFSAFIFSPCWNEIWITLSSLLKAVILIDLIRILWS